MHIDIESIKNSTDNTVFCKNLLTSGDIRVILHINSTDNTQA